MKHHLQTSRSPELCRIGEEIEQASEQREKVVVVITTQAWVTYWTFVLINKNIEWELIKLLLLLLVHYHHNNNELQFENRIAKIFVL